MTRPLRAIRRTWRPFRAILRAVPVSVSVLLLFALLPTMAAAEAKVINQAGDGTVLSAEWHTCFRVVQEGPCHVLSFNASETNLKHESGTPGVIVCVAVDYFFIPPDGNIGFVGFEGGCGTGPSGSLVATSDLSSVSLLPITVAVDRFECTLGSCTFAGTREVSFSVEFTGREPEIFRSSKQMQTFGGCTLKTESRGASRTGVATALYDGIVFPEKASDDRGFVSNVNVGSFREWAQCEDTDEFPFLPTGDTLTLETRSSTCDGVTDGECDNFALFAQKLVDLTDGQEKVFLCVGRGHVQILGGEFISSSEESACVEAPAGVLSASSKLTSATLSPTTVTVELFTCTRDTCESLGSREVTVSAVFAGTGDVLDEGTFKLKAREGGCVQTFTSKAERRLGEATVTYDGISLPMPSASLERSKGTSKETCKK